MSEAMSSAANSRALVDQEELRMAVAELFCVFKRKYGHRWREQFEDPQSRPVWFASLRAAGITAESVKHGLAQLSKVGTGWPPSDEEFIALCRPPSPALDKALAEALAWARNPSHEFSHPAIGAAAKSVTGWTLRTETEHKVRQLFDGAYRIALNLHARGADLDVPIPRALPATVRNRIPPGAKDPAAVAEARAKAALLLGLA